MTVCGCIVFAATVLPGAVRGADWPQWRGPNRDGKSAEVGWLNAWPPSVVWTQNVGQGYSGMAVSEGRLYTLGFDGSTLRDTVYCFNATNGAELWRFSYQSTNTFDGYEGPRATPIVDGAEVFTYSHEGHFFAFNKYTGITNWYKFVNYGKPSWKMSGSPLVRGDAVFFNAGGAGQAVSRSGAHATLWWNPGIARYASPIEAAWNGQTSVVIIAQTGLYGLNPANGQTNYSYAWSSSYSSADPVFYGDKVFLSSSDMGGCVLLRLTNGPLNAIYSTNALRSECSTPMLVGDYVYGFIAWSSDLLCMDIRNGVVQWSVPGYFQGEYSEGTLIAADGRLIVLSRKGKLNVIKASPASCDSEGRTPASVVPNAESEQWWTPPALANGMIYCRSWNGTLAALRVGIPDAWKQHYLGGTTNSPPGADADADRSTDMSEYVAGTDPTNAQSNLKLQIVPGDGGQAVSWPTKSVSGIGYDPAQSRYYSLETRPSLLTGSWQAVAGYTDVTGNNATVVFTNTAPDPTGLYRVGVKLR